MRRVVILLFGLVFFASVQVHAVFAQITDNDALFAVIQRQLAVDPSTWSIRVPDKKNNNVFVPVPERPQDIVRREDQARTSTNDFNTSSWAPGELLRKYVLFDAKMANTRALGDVIRQLTDDKFFEGNYILTTNETSELGKIKDLYGQVVAGITRYDTGRVGANNTLASCLRDSAGVCRHMATILEKSLEKAGVTSQQMISPEHHWVRVTLSDPAYKGIIFDLDPTWYQQAIPLAPRDNSSMSTEWSNRMLAITSASSGSQGLNGKWSVNAPYTKEVEIIQVGDSLSAVVLKSSGPYIGTVSFIGTKGENGVNNGQVLLHAAGCPNLDGYVPAKQTVSSDGMSIQETYSSSKYNTQTCRYVGSSTAYQTTYTRIVDNNADQ